MTATLEIVVPPETEQWLRDRVATGGYASIGELIESLVAEHQVSELDLAEDSRGQNPTLMRPWRLWLGARSCRLKRLSRFSRIASGDAGDAGS
jgi:Arc/MetJ-type ribon-helix-helix transcriptional regulator